MIDKVREAAKKKHTIEMYYRGKANTATRRYAHLEPYSIKNGGLFAFDPNANSIKRFKVEGICSVSDEGLEFTPRWEVEL